jgi:hypothetical protein
MNSGNIKKWDNIPRLCHYGERGILNSIVTHLHRDSSFPNVTKKFLKAIKWAKGAKQEWIEKVSDARIIVELGLAQFGDPDLIIVCKTHEGEIHCLFIEAKAKTYEESAIDNEQGMAIPGYNSSINGQISLKYRFAKALNAFKEGNNLIEEAEHTFLQYEKQLKDGNKLPRKIEKRRILEDIIKPLGLLGLKDEYFHYVALTWDREDHVFFDSKNKPESSLPLFLDEKGENIYDQIMERLGWIGYKQLEMALGLENDEEYKAALRTMVPLNEPKENYYDILSGQGWRNYPEVTHILAENVSSYFKQSEGYTVVEYRGSYSVKEIGNFKYTIIKIIPLKTGIFLGIRDTYLDPKTSKRIPHLIEKKAFGRAFWGIEIPIGATPFPEIKDSSAIEIGLKLVEHFSTAGV